MPLTVPEFPSTSPECLVTVSSVDGEVTLNFTLTAAQVEAWSDDDLLARLETLKTGLRGFLVPGVDIQVSVYWVSRTSADGLSTYETA